MITYHKAAERRPFLYFSHPFDLLHGNPRGMGNIFPVLYGRRDDVHIVPTTTTVFPDAIYAVCRMRSVATWRKKFAPYILIFHYKYNQLRINPPLPIKNQNIHDENRLTY